MLKEPGLENSIGRIAPSSPLVETVKPVTFKSVLLCTLLSCVYLVLSYFLVGYKADQLVLVLIFNFCFFVSKVTRQFIIGFSIFIIYWILFDYMKAFPNYLFNTVHIADLYQAEKALFGFDWNGVRLTPAPP